MLAAIVLGAILHPAAPVAGHWQGSMMRGAGRLRVSFDFPGDAAGRGLFSAPDVGAIDIPLTNVRRAGAVHWELKGDASTTTFDGTAKGDGMTGVFHGDGRAGTFAVRRTSLSIAKPYATHDVTFANGGVRLAGTVFVPRTTGPHPAMIFVQGSGPEGRWASAYLADFVARHGVVALTYDKRGVGASTGDWRASTMDDLANDARAGVALLAQRADVNPHRIGVYGHSQGGTLAPAIAARNARVAWIVAADGLVGPSYRQDLFRVDNDLATRYSGKQLAQAKALYAEFVEVARTGSSHEKLRADIARAAHAPWLGDLAIPGDDSWVWTWYARTANYDSTAAWSAVRVPVLILFGANDRLVPARETVARTAAILRANGDPHVVTHVFPGADHTLRIPPATPDGWPHEPVGFPDILATFANGTR